MLEYFLDGDKFSMKIMMENKVYIQLNDVMYLLEFFENKPIPAVIFERCFSKPLIVDDSNRYEFIEFTEPEAIEFFRSYTYSVDLLALLSFTDEELMKKGSAISEERNKIASRYNAMTDEEKNNCYDLVNECELLEFKMYSIRDILWFKQGHLKFELPKEIKKDSTLGIGESGIKRFFKRFKREES